MQKRNRLLELLFPPRCALCRRLVEAPLEVCPDCGRKYKVGQRVLHPAGGEFFRDCAAPLPYEGDVRRAILRFKFYGHKSAVPTFARWMASCVRTAWPEQTYTVTYAPVSAKRRRKRGFDQSELLAKAVAAELGMECVRLLEKQRDTVPQSTLPDPARRRANVADVYHASDPAAIRGRHILLVDDIMTTGATLSECARTLLMNGAERIDCVVLAAKK